MEGCGISMTDTNDLLWTLDVARQNLPLETHPSHYENLREIERIIRQKTGQREKRVPSTLISYCQSCGRDLVHGERVHYVPCDNNIVCLACSDTFTAKKEERIYLAR